MAWHQLSVITNEQTAPEVSDFFSNIGAISVTYMDAEDQPVYEPNIGETKIWQHTQIIALFELDAEPDLIKSALINQFGESLLHSWHYEKLEDQVWERTWMEHYQPMKFAGRLWVCPTGQEQHETGTVCLTLDPGLAFGTGTHPTTSLCLEWLASHDLNGKTVIDFGCGSGILAVAAVLLGAKEVHAIDIDPQALTATQDNALKNDIQGQIHCYLPEQFCAQPADIVIANILANPLIELSDKISEQVKPTGHLVLSGILNEQAGSVIQAYQNQFSIKPPTSRDDWCRLDALKQ